MGKALACEVMRHVRRLKFLIVQKIDSTCYNNLEVGDNADENNKNNMTIKSYLRVAKTYWCSQYPWAMIHANYGQGKIVLLIAYMPQKQKLKVK